MNLGKIESSCYFKQHIKAIQHKIFSVKAIHRAVFNHLAIQPFNPSTRIKEDPG